MLDQFNRGTEDALACFGVKVARGQAVQVPAWHQDLMFARHGDVGSGPPPQTPPSWGSDFHRGLQQHMHARGGPASEGTYPAPPTAAGPVHTQGPAPMPMPGEQRMALPSLAAKPGAMSTPSMRPAAAPAAAPHAPAAAPHAPMPAAAPAAAAGAAGRFKMPSLGWKGMVGLGALGAGAAALHHQHQRDVQGNNMTYAPMQGGMF